MPGRDNDERTVGPFHLWKPARHADDEVPNEPRIAQVTQVPALSAPSAPRKRLLSAFSQNPDKSPIQSQERAHGPLLPE
jgi:hypothetical protein